MTGLAPTSHPVRGKAAAGRSALAARLGAAPGTVVIAEDAWLTALFGDRVATGGDHLRYSARLREATAPHVTALPRTGVSVVLDFPANTVETRAWMRSLAQAAGADTLLYVPDLPDAVRKARLRARNGRDAHLFTLTEEQVDQLA